MYLTSTGSTEYVVLAVSSTGNVLMYPERSGGGDQQYFLLNDRTASAYGFLFHAAQGSGGSTAPSIYVGSTGVFSAIYFNGILYSNLVTNGVNYLNVVGSSSGNHPYVAAYGVDTDVDVRVIPQGAGALRLAYPALALGGGSAATLGTIGGSGPGVAGQAYWMEIHISTSTARYFLPVWST